MHVAVNRGHVGLDDFRVAMQRAQGSIPNFVSSSKQTGRHDLLGRLEACHFN